MSRVVLLARSALAGVVLALFVAAIAARESDRRVAAARVDGGAW